MLERDRVEVGAGDHLEQLVRRDGVEDVDPAAEARVGGQPLDGRALAAVAEVDEMGRLEARREHRRGELLEPAVRLKAPW